MSCCARAAPALLLHVSLLLAAVGGAGLATAARLKWDPTTYVALRELFPLEYRVGAAALCAGAAAVLALAHLAVLALSLPARRARLRRALLYTYAGTSAALLCVAAGWVGWTAARVAAWLHSAQAAQVAEALEVREHVTPLLQYSARWLAFPARLQALLAEAEADAPRNLHVACAALALAAALLLAAVLLALLCASRGRASRATARTSAHQHTSFTSTDSESAPLRTAYKNGKLVIL